VLKRAELEKLIGDLADAMRERDSLLFDEEYPHTLGKPASAKQLAALESRLGAPLPPSYRAFLELHNGWEKFTGGAKLLATEDHEAAWVKQFVDSMDTLFYEQPKVENPFAVGAIPILAGEDVNKYLVLDPRKVGSDGEMTFVQYEYTRKERRFKNFTQFLQHELKLLQERIEDQKKGS
jgi:hypothetical protein